MSALDCKALQRPSTDCPTDRCKNCTDRTDREEKRVQFSNLFKFSTVCTVCTIFTTVCGTVCRRSLDALCSCACYPSMWLVLFLKHFISQSLQILAFIFKNFSSGSVQFFSCLSNRLLFSFRSSMNLASCRRNYKLCLTRVILQLGL